MNHPIILNIQNSGSLMIYPNIRLMKIYLYYVIVLFRSNVKNISVVVTKLASNTTLNCILELFSLNTPWWGMQQLFCCKGLCNFVSKNNKYGQILNNLSWSHNIDFYIQVIYLIYLQDRKIVFWQSMIIFLTILDFFWKVFTHYFITIL